MSRIARALYCAINIGFGDYDVQARALDLPFNVGIEVMDVAARGLFAPANIGFSDENVQARGLYAPFAVFDFSDPNDGVEIQLIFTDIKTVLHNLAGK
jgi:hypothetical protein